MSKQPSSIEATKYLCPSRPGRYGLTGHQLLLASPNIANQFQFLDELLVLSYAEQHRGAVAVLGQDEGSVATLEFVDVPGDVGSKFG